MFLRPGYRQKKLSTHSDAMNLRALIANCQCFVELFLYLLRTVVIPKAFGHYDSLKEIDRFDTMQKSTLH